MKRFAFALGLVALTACTSDTEEAQASGELRYDGYALFAVENDRQQQNTVTVRVEDAEPLATYVLLYADFIPRSTGWFQLDPKTLDRCGGSLGPHCGIPDVGYLVDVATVPAGASSITLRDGRCGCDADHETATGPATGRSCASSARAAPGASSST